MTHMDIYVSCFNFNSLAPASNFEWKGDKSSSSGETMIRSWVSQAPIRQKHECLLTSQMSYKWAKKCQQYHLIESFDTILLWQIYYAANSEWYISYQKTAFCVTKHLIILAIYTLLNFFPLTEHFCANKYVKALHLFSFHMKMQRHEHNFYISEKSCRESTGAALIVFLLISLCTKPDSKVDGANMGLTWGQNDPGGPHVGPKNLSIWESLVAIEMRWLKSHVMSYWWVLGFPLVHEFRFKILNWFH